MQVMFVVGLEAQLKGVASEAGGAAARVGLQDDVTLFGSAQCIGRMWPSLVGRLEQAGRRLRPHKCSAWAPGWEDAEEHELPEACRQLLQLVPRSRSSVQLFGS
eukprot:4447602-Lingulodinium_polyedra.AAC.1